MAFQKKTVSANAEGVVGSAVVNLNKGVESLKEAVATLNTLVAKAEEQQLEITNKEEKIKSLDVEFAEKARQHTVEFGLKVKESEFKVVESILAAQHLVAVPEQELKTLNQKLVEATTTLEEKVKAAVGQAHGIASAKAESDKKLLESNFRAEQAADKATIVSLTAQLTASKQESEHLRKAADAERAASIERAKAGSIGTINLGSTETGRR